MPPDPVILILAAGSSSRMSGADKLLEPVCGEPLIRRQARIALDTGCLVIITLPADRPARLQALAGLPVETVIVPDAHLGMAASLRRGVEQALKTTPTPTGLMILPADMPDFTPAALRMVIAAWGSDPTMIRRGTTPDGRPGHPALFPADLLPALARQTGDRGGRAVLAQAADRVRHVALPGDMAVTDLDTPEDWTRWRARSEES